LKQIEEGKVISVFAALWDHNLEAETVASNARNDTVWMRKLEDEVVHLNIMAGFIKVEMEVGR
jgi:hypothetical protein